MIEKDIAIAIDGPAAAGKSTVAKNVADDLHYIYIDTGAMYRSLTYEVIKQGVSTSKEEEVLQVLLNTEIMLHNENNQQVVTVNNENITEEIRKEEVTNAVSEIASFPSVRIEMVKRQQKLALMRGVVMDGRDIGTHVIPDAEVKVFLIASVEERAQRRHKENKEKGFPSDLEAIKRDIALRDKMDSERQTSPLKKAEDAIEIDTTSMTINDVTKQILNLVQAYKEA
ncbi:cytidylate kinase [Saliterribacillus persicus]|uniref:Cytidylate kinase n=1 Tax=Saliterribacillus persicus TaxID=930114 RepID=A0A368XEK3_9BACI|nr:cytidylate kinase [Saliterribacillus persicus]